MSLVKCIDCTFATVDGLCLYKGAYTPLHSDACESFQPRDDVRTENAKLKAENAKLRGLVQGMWHDGLCSECRYHFHWKWMDKNNDKE